MQLVNVNVTISDCDFHNELKLADIIPTQKGDEKICLSNYRPDNILPVFSKFYERVMQMQINNFIDKKPF